MENMVDQTTAQERSVKRSLPSLHDVAKEAGVSLSTASRSLDPASRHPVSAALRVKVKSAAEAIGYEPNLWARALRTQAQLSVAVMVHDITDEYFSEVIRGVTNAALQEGWLTIVCDSGRDPTAELKYLSLLFGTRVAAVVLAGGEFYEANYRAEINARLKDLNSYGAVTVALAPRGESIATERSDDFGGAQTATNYLLDLGHTRVALIAGPKVLSTSILREAGYVRALRNRGLDPSITWQEFSRPGGVEGVRALLRHPQKPTAILAAADALAIGAMSELHRCGYAIPEDMSVVGFDDIGAATFANPPLTTIRVPVAKIAAAGFARVLNLLSTAGADSPERIHPVDLIVRETTSRPRANDDAVNGR